VSHLTPKSREKLQLFYDYVHKQPCLCCGAVSHIEAAHFEGILSKKVKGQWMPRSKKTIAAFSAISLCQNCHTQGENAQHNSREIDWLEDNIPQGKAGAQAFVIRAILESIGGIE
jgi:hypothetical protein